MEQIDILTAWLHDQPLVHATMRAVIVLLIAWLSFYTARLVLLRALPGIIRRTRTKLDDILLEHGVLRRVALLAPIIVLSYGADQELYPDRQDHHLLAVVILVFRDTILSLVASFTIASNRMIRVGDWIEAPAFGADGDVVDVALHTVKVQNWDKTITSIPTHKLVEVSFKNWRGMRESGGRRIKRAIHLDMNSVRFCDEEMLDRFESIELIRDYVREQRQVVASDNTQRRVDISELVNGRRLTNVGTFRAYVAAYLRNHPRISQDMTFLVRHRAPTPQGLPLEIYVFTTTTEWVEYEGIQSDILDHLLAAVPRFGLRVFQEPTGSELARALSG